MEKSEKRCKKAALFRRKSAAGSILVALQDMEILKPLAPQGFPGIFGSHLVAKIFGYTGDYIAPKISHFPRILRNRNAYLPGPSIRKIPSLTKSYNLDGNAYLKLLVSPAQCFALNFGQICPNFKVKQSCVTCFYSPFMIYSP